LINNTNSLITQIKTNHSLMILRAAILIQKQPQTTAHSNGAYTTGNVVYSSPAVGSDGTVYVGSYDHKLYAINSSSEGLADSPWPKFRHDNHNTGCTNFIEFSIVSIMDVPNDQGKHVGIKWNRHPYDIAGATDTVITKL